MKYQVYCKLANGNGSFLSHLNRTEWGYRTAKKHARDCAEKIAKGEWSRVQYVAVVAA